jgi:hypothetical protein
VAWPGARAAIRRPRAQGRSLLMVAEAWIVALLKKPASFNQLTWL